MSDNRQPSTEEFVTMQVMGQSFGIPILLVRDILRAQPLSCVPLAPPEVAGLLNLRGRIATAIDMRKKLALQPPKDAGQGMHVVVEHENELFSLLVDEVGDVVNLPSAVYEPNPPTLERQWRAVSGGVYWLKDRLMLALDLPCLLNINEARAPSSGRES